MRPIKTSVFVGTSLDGFIARENGDLDWLIGSGEGSGANYGFNRFFNTVDVLVMGRNTYEKVLRFDEWYYGSKPVVVLTSRPLKIPPRLSATVEVMDGEPGAIIERLAARGAKHLYIDGGKTIQSFLSAGLISTIIISRLPVLIGNGIPLFGPVPHDIKLRHIATREFAGGMVQSEYEVLK